MINVNRVALLTRHVDFTIKAKHALENRDGRYYVTAFTSVQNLLQFLETNEQDVAILDLTVRDVVPDKLIIRIKDMQSAMKVVVAPNHPAVLSALASLQINGIIDIPMPTRQLLGFMNKLMTAPEDLPHVLMPNANDLLTVIDSQPEVETLPDIQPTAEAEALFQRLAAEEPPMPTFEESATIADVVENFMTLEAEEKLAVLNTIEPEMMTTAQSESPAESLAAQILEAALDTSTPVNAVLTKIKERITNEDLLVDNREPDFLEALPKLPLEYSASTTAFSNSDAIVNVNDLTTDRLEPIVRSRPILEGDFPSLDDLHPEPITTPTFLPNTPPPPEQVRPPVLLASTSEPTPESEVAQLAVTLTEMSVETAADAVILVRDGEMVAFSGRLPRAEIEPLMDVLTAPWDDERKTIVEFVRIDSTSTDYVLHGVLTTSGFILYLLFAGSIPISAIRRQGRTISDALAALPSESTPVTAPGVPDEEAFDEDDYEYDDEDSAEYEDESAEQQSVAAAGTQVAQPTEELYPYNFVWVLRDTSNPLNNDTARSLVNALNTTLRQRTWRIKALDVYSDFVYLRADLPQSQGASRAVREAMRASAELLQPTTPTWANSIWSDSYLVVPSERELAMEEITAFIQFARS